MRTYRPNDTNYSAFRDTLLPQVMQGVVRVKVKDLTTAR